MKRLWWFFSLVWRPFDAIDGKAVRVSIATAWYVAGMFSEAA